MTTYFVSRHDGAREWAVGQGLVIDQFIGHLQLEAIVRGDVVIGNLPIHLAAEVCAHGARYVHLAVDTPPHRRGEDLCSALMQASGARLVEFKIERVG